MFFSENTEVIGGTYIKINITYVVRIVCNWKL